MLLVMKLEKLLTGAALGIAGVLAIIFALDFALGIPFEGFSRTTDIIVIVACGLLIWSGIETWRER